MDWVKTVLQWFAGGRSHPYHTLWQCMHGDLLWVVITVLLDLAVAGGYIVIAMHWMRNERFLPPSPAKRAMAEMKNIFILCGLCGYLFIPIKLFWPAWRLYDLFLLLLAFQTWKYAWGAKDLKVVYNELGRTSRLAQELEASKAEVQRRSDFLNAVSHDLRTPLNGLTLRTNLAEMQLGMEDKAGLEQSLAEIRQSAQGVAEMLDQLLDYSRIERDISPPARERFKLSEVVAEVLLDVGPSAELKSLRVLNEVPPSLWLLSDRLKLKRVLNNLVSNAVKFTQQGSVRVVTEWRNRDVEIHVIDTGVGIPPEKVGMIFDEFYQVGNDQRDRRKGFGMGLPIARQLTARIGGEVQVHSALGQGSRFTIVLPGTVDLEGSGVMGDSHPAVAQGKGV